MAQFTSNLDRVRIAAPCNADWDAMFGDNQVRFCGQCQLNVYNLSEMTRTDAEMLIARTEGRLCVRYYRRRDGSILTQNCPVGVRAIKQRLSRVASAIGSALLSFFAGIGAHGVANRLSLVTPARGELMGEIAISKPEVVGKLVPLPPPPGRRLGPQRLKGSN